MADENRSKQAQAVYKTLCTALDNREWSYEKKEEGLMVHFSVSGDDIPMRIIIFVDEERQMIRLLSPFPFEMAEDKRMEAALAVCVASRGKADGSFDYDLTNGEIIFRMTESYRGSEIGEELFQYMISYACDMVDSYNDRFLALSKGYLGIKDFIEKE